MAKMTDTTFPTEDLELHAFDLPQLHQKPSSRQLLDTLASLKLTPRSWQPGSVVRGSDNSRPSSTGRNQSSSHGIVHYLTTIVSSGLKWIENDAEREEIWEQASQRLSERSGRSAMSGFTRNFQVPTQSGNLSICIHEPALTSDNLGFKTWAASYVLASRLCRINLPAKLVETVKSQSAAILELGSGTGLVGIAAAAILGAVVHMTDLGTIQSNLERNATANADLVHRYGGKLRSTVLDWNHPTSLDWTIRETASSASDDNHDLKVQDYPLILGADCIYSAEHPKLLANTIKIWLSKTIDSRFVMELPLRPGYNVERHDFRKAMNDVGLFVIEEDEDIGHDDWGSNETDDVDAGRVRCWYSVWAWG